MTDDRLAPFGLFYGAFLLYIAAIAFFKAIRSHARQDQETQVTPMPMTREVAIEYVSAALQWEPPNGVRHSVAASSGPTVSIMLIETHGPRYLVVHITGDQSPGDLHGFLDNAAVEMLRGDFDEDDSRPIRFAARGGDGCGAVHFGGASR